MIARGEPEHEPSGAIQYWSTTGVSNRGAGRVGKGPEDRNADFLAEVRDGKQREDSSGSPRERREVHDVFGGDGLHRESALLPCTHSALDDDRFPALVEECPRHAQARCIAQSSAIEVNALAGVDAV
jgi:hypothetical protein